MQLLNNDVLATSEAHGGCVNAVPSDNGRVRRVARTSGAPASLCGREDQHPYELFLQLEGIEHRRTKIKRPQSNGIVERLHRTLLDEHFRVEGRCTWFETIDEMQIALDGYLKTYNES